MQLGLQINDKHSRPRQFGLAALVMATLLLMLTDIYMTQPHRNAKFFLNNVATALQQLQILCALLAGIKHRAV